MLANAARWNRSSIDPKLSYEQRAAWKKVYFKIAKVRQFLEINVKGLPAKNERFQRAAKRALPSEFLAGSPTALKKN